MLSDDIIAAELEVCRQQRKQIQISKSKLREWGVALSHQEKALHALRQSQQKLAETQEELKPALRGVQLSLLRPDADGRMVAPLNIIGSGKKPDVQVLEEIFIAYGPLRRHDVVRRGQERGVAFKGKKRPMPVARDNLTASKRFALLGNNVWGLPNQEVPEHYSKGADPARNGR